MDGSQCKVFGKQVIARVKCLKNFGMSSGEQNFEEFI